MLLSIEPSLWRDFSMNMYSPKYSVSMYFKNILCSREISDISKFNKIYYTFGKVEYLQKTKSKSSFER